MSGDRQKYNGRILSAAERGSSEVQWVNPDVYNLEIVNCNGEWRIPRVEEPAPWPKTTEASLDFANFVPEPTKEVILFSSQTLSFFKLSITIPVVSWRRMV
jgi:hypothetical protein